LHLLPQEIKLYYNEYAYDCYSSRYHTGNYQHLLSEFRLQVEHIPGAQDAVVDGLTRILYLDFKKFRPSVQYYLKDDSTQRIFRMVNFKVDFQDTGDSGSEYDELEVLRAQDENSEVRLQKGYIYKALKLSGHDWMGMKDQLTNGE